MPFSLGSLFCCSFNCLLLLFLFCFVFCLHTHALTSSPIHQSNQTNPITTITIKRNQPSKQVVDLMGQPKPSPSHHQQPNQTKPTIKQNPTQAKRSEIATLKTTRQANAARNSGKEDKKNKTKSAWNHAMPRLRWIVHVCCDVIRAIIRGMLCALAVVARASSCIPKTQTLCAFCACLCAICECL